MLEKNICTRTLRGLLFRMLSRIRSHQDAEIRLRNHRKRRRTEKHLKCFCWAKNICKPSVPFLLLQIGAMPCTLAQSKLHQHAVEILSSAALFSFRLRIHSIALVLKTSFQPINCFLLNLTQQLKFFRCRLEIVVLSPLLCNVRIFLISGPSTR